MRKGNKEITPVIYLNESINFSHEKCEHKRNTIKRLCIKSLPQTLFIQLKRFHYDFETNRAVKFDDHFKFPWTLDMTPYTVDGIQA